MRMDNNINDAINDQIEQRRYIALLLIEGT